MFTGLIESVGTVTAWQPSAEAARLQVCVAWPSGVTRQSTQLGDSVAVNGCCLTVVALVPDGDGERLDFELSHETLARTALDALRPASRVNLERAMRLGDRLGGHMVSGHVDGVAQLVGVAVREGAWDLTYAVPAALEPELVIKGSVALDGVSLTINALPQGHLQVTLIPHTVAHTQLLDGGTGKRVHIETDLIAKHVRRLVEMGVGSRPDGWTAPRCP